MASLRCLATAAVILLALACPVFAQETHYIYDPLGQLIGAVDPQGRTTIYEYDEVGNLLAVRGSQTTGPVAITFVNPNIGPAGTVVEIFGVGFSGIPSQNQVAFNGVAASVASSSSTYLVTTVPAGAASGPITVTTPLGSATSPSPFQVPGGVSISPTQAIVNTATYRQFTAIVANSPDQRVNWSVNGVAGGNATVGTITVEGRYRAPDDVPAPPTVVVRVSSVPFPTLFAEASVLIVARPPSGIIATPVDIRVVRPGTGDPGGLATNVTVATPPFISLVRPGTGDPGGLGLNLTVAVPPFISLVRPGTGDPGGLPLNVTVAKPPDITVVRQ